MLLWVGPQIQAMLRSELTDRPSLSRPKADLRLVRLRCGAASQNWSLATLCSTIWQAKVGSAGPKRHFVAVTPMAAPRPRADAVSLLQSVKDGIHALRAAYFHIEKMPRK